MAVPSRPTWRHHALVLGSLLAVAAADPPDGPFPVLGGLIGLYGVVLVLVQFWGWWVGRGSAATGGSSTR